MRTVNYLFFLAAFFLLAGCDNDLELAADWKDIPIVYGIVDLQDTAHYIRVEKAFLDPDGNAFQTAQIVDSLYYSEEVTVSLINNTTGLRVLLDRVDGAQEGYPRESGEFANDPNYLYKVKGDDFPMEGEDNIELEINRGDQLPLVTAEAEVLGEITPTNFEPGTKLDFPTDFDANFRFRSGNEARIFDLILTINYFERQVEDPDVIEFKSMDWLFAKGVRRASSGSITTAKVLGLEFYQFLSDNLQPDVTIERGIVDMEVQILGGGEAVEQYISIALANTGITSSQEIPIYTNLSEGRGIFTSGYRSITKNMILTQPSKDSLFFGQLTKDLNFVQ